MAIAFFLQHGTGTKGPFKTEEVAHKESVLPWQAQGLSYTASGYGAKIPTRNMVNFLGRWHRVYCSIFSNIGTLFIVSRGEKIVVTTYGE